MLPVAPESSFSGPRDLSETARIADKQDRNQRHSRSLRTFTKRADDALHVETASRSDLRIQLYDGAKKALSAHDSQRWFGPG